MIIRIRPAGAGVQKIDLDILKNGTFVIRVDDMHKGSGRWAKNEEVLELEAPALDDLLGSDATLSFPVYDEPRAHRR